MKSDFIGLGMEEQRRLILKAFVNIIKNGGGSWMANDLVNIRRKEEDNPAISWLNHFVFSSAKSASLIIQASIVTLLKLEGGVFCMAVHFARFGIDQTWIIWLFARPYAKILCSEVFVAYARRTQSRKQTWLIKADQTTGLCCLRVGTLEDQTWMIIDGLKFTAECALIWLDTGMRRLTVSVLGPPSRHWRSRMQWQFQKLASCSCRIRCLQLSWWFALIELW